MKCTKCGSSDTRPMATKPPAQGGRGNHVCDEKCWQQGVFCRNCRFFRPVASGGRLEVNEHDGLGGAWELDPNHGPWQATAPGWAVREFATVKAMMRDGRWFPPVVVSDLGEGHVVHCLGIWDDGKRVVEPERNTYYEATVKWSDGETRPLILWNNTGLR